MKRALVLHLYYEDVALDLIARIGALPAGMAVFLTGPRPTAAIAKALERKSIAAEWIDTGEAGFDVAPFLAVLALLAERGYDVFWKLHTKRGDDVPARRWREILLNALATPVAIVRLSDRFARSPDLLMAGPADLFLSVETNLYKNGPNLRRLAEACFPGAPVPRDWGFFAGTMFCGRVETFLPFLRLRDAFAEVAAGEDRRDGEPAHAVERLFGLAPVLAGGRIGLIGSGADGAIAEIDGAEATGRRLTIGTALARAGLRPGGTLSEDEQRAAAADNPLLHYLATGAGGDIDPNPFFPNAWYRTTYRTAPDVPPLRDFLRRAADTPRPGPLFDAVAYVRERPWLARRRINPLAHYLAHAAADGADAPDPLPPPRESRRDWRIDEKGKQGETPALRLRAVLENLRHKTTWQIAINIAAPKDAVSEWGDTSFAEGFAAALTRVGHAVTVNRRDDWHARDGEAPDVAIWLRGPAPCEPHDATALNLVWIISHPDQVTYEEMEAFDLVCVASDSFASFLATFLATPVASLLQATDRERFRPLRQPVHGNQVLFAGNTRGEDRPVVRWALDAGLDVQLFGFGWEKAAAAANIRAGRIANRDLPPRYARSAAVLNDHWPAMTEFGIVGNRLFDVLAAGGVPVSDCHPAIDRVLGEGSVIQVARPQEIAAAVAAAAGRAEERRAALSETVRTAHSFDRRAAEMVADIGALGDGRPLRRQPARGPRVHVLMPAGHGAANLAFARLVAPLTHERAQPLALRVGSPADLGDDDADIVIATALSADDLSALEAAATHAARRSARLFLDCPCGIEAPADTGRLAEVLASAHQCWVPNADIAAHAMPASMNIAVVPDSIDQRIWRDFHRPPKFSPAARLRLALFANGVPPRVLAQHLAILRELALLKADRLSVTLVGPAEGHAGIDWAETLSPPAGASPYPRRAAWLRHEPRFDVGICLAPEGDLTAAAAADRMFLEYSALGLLTVVVGPGLAGTAMAERRLVLATTRADLPAMLEDLTRDPHPLGAVAGAATDYVWQERSAGGPAAFLKTALN